MENSTGVNRKPQRIEFKNETKRSYNYTKYNELIAEYRKNEAWKASLE